MNAGTASLFEPSHTQAFGVVADWLPEVLSGSLATALGIVAIGLVGLSLFQGRLRLKHAALVVMGIFLLMGAPVIGAGIVGNSHQASLALMPTTVAPPPAVPSNNLAPPANPFDPYAGASVPTQ
jgi:type IV secretory pathway VirB2 component (pilin)